MDVSCLGGDILREIENWSTGKQVQRVFWLSGLTGKSTIAQTSAETMFMGGEFRPASPVLNTLQVPYDLPNTRLPARPSVSTFPRGAAPHPPPTVCCSRSSSPPPPELGRLPHQHTSHDKETYCAYFDSILLFRVHLQAFRPHTHLPMQMLHKFCLSTLRNLKKSKDVHPLLPPLMPWLWISPIIQKLLLTPPNLNPHVCKFPHTHHSPFILLATRSILPRINTRAIIHHSYSRPIFQRGIPCVVGSVVLYCFYLDFIGTIHLSLWICKTRTRHNSEV